MEEGAKARVDYLVQVVYRRKSEVWLLLLARCGRGCCGHRRSVNVGFAEPNPEVIAVISLGSKRASSGTSRV